MKKYLLLIFIGINALMMIFDGYVFLRIMTTGHAVGIHYYREMEVALCIDWEKMEEFSKGRFVYPDNVKTAVWLTQPALDIAKIANGLLYITVLINLFVGLIFLTLSCVKRKFLQRIRLLTCGVMVIIVNACLFIIATGVAVPLANAPSRIMERYEELKDAGCIREENLPDFFFQKPFKTEEGLMAWMSEPVFATTSFVQKILLTAVSINLFIGTIFFLVGIFFYVKDKHINKAQHATR